MSETVLQTIFLIIYTCTRNQMKAKTVKIHNIKLRETVALCLVDGCGACGVESSGFVVDKGLYNNINIRGIAWL